MRGGAVSPVAGAVSNTGVITVMSGRWVPPWYGSFSMNTSPGRMRPALRSITAFTLSPIEPRCTGMCGALAISWPFWSNSAQEKSRRSLMFTEQAVLASVSPICSAIAMNRLLKISSMIGSALVPIAVRAGRSTTRSSSRSPPVRVRADQPGSTTVVPLASAMIAGPSTRAPSDSASRTTTGVSCQQPSLYIGTRVTAIAAAGIAARPASVPLPSAAPWPEAAVPVSPIASTVIDSTTRSRPGIRKL